MTVADLPAPAIEPPAGVRLRLATEADVPVCGSIWREGLNDYMGRLGLPAIPDELGPIRRLHAHLHATDPERFWVATRDAGEAAHAGPPIAFGAATRREAVWFLSMLFVRPGEQGKGIGRALLGRLIPGDDAALATGTDSAQPISNALYAELGMVPRMPLLSLIGHAERPAALGALPSAIRPQSFEDFIAGSPGVDGHRLLAEAVDSLDRELAGFAHPQDHRYLRVEGRRGFVYRGIGDAIVGYGYASEVGRVGPVAVRDEALVAPILGHLLQAVPPRGASAVWAPGHAGPAVAGLLRAGLRLDGFPVLLCWSRPFADFARYLPISPGLL
jgi:GNAT superfamily N-acetyltransferase